MVLLAVAVVFFSFKLLTVFIGVADKIMGVSIGGLDNTLKDEVVATYKTLTAKK